MLRHIVRHGATAVAASAISVLLIAGMALAASGPIAGGPRDRSAEERSTACFTVTDPAKLDARIVALQADLDARLDAAVAAGVLTKDAATEISERVAKFLQRCREKASEPDPKARSGERGLGEIFRLGAGREIGSFFRACFDPSLAGRQDQLKAALATLTTAIDTAVADGTITPERGTELKARLAEFVARCDDRVLDRDRDQHRRGDHHGSDRRGESATPSAATPPPQTGSAGSFRSFEQFFRPTSTATPTTSPTRSTSFGSRSSDRSWSGSR